MYKNGLVMSVGVGGQTQREDNGKIVIPFNSEYVLRLKNKNNRDALCNLYIDGKPVCKSGGLVVRGNSTIDVERFIEDLSQGNRFKFVPLKDRKVEDKGEPENGLIEARFYLAKEKLLPEIIKIKEYEYIPYPVYPRPWYPWPYVDPYIWPRPYPYWEPYIWYCSDNQTITTGRGSSASYSYSSCNNGDSHLSNNVNDLANCAKDLGLISESAGATVKGSRSNQKFESAPELNVEDEATILTLKLVGVDKGKVVEIARTGYCKGCGRRKRDKDSYCASCGSKY